MTTDTTSLFETVFSDEFTPSALAEVINGHAHLSISLDEVVVLEADEYVNEDTQEKSLIVNVHDNRLLSKASEFCTAYDKAFKDSKYLLLRTLHYGRG